MKGRRRHDTSFGGYRLNCSLNAVPDLLIIAAAAGYLYYYPLSICHFIFLLENHPCDFYSPPPPPTTTTHRSKTSRTNYALPFFFFFFFFLFDERVFVNTKKRWDPSNLNVSSIPYLSFESDEYPEQTKDYRLSNQRVDATRFVLNSEMDATFLLPKLDGKRDETVSPT